MPRLVATILHWRGNRRIRKGEVFDAPEGFKSKYAVPFEEPKKFVPAITETSPIPKIEAEPKPEAEAKAKNEGKSSKA
jgi:hypothetical protein